jgi:cyanophycinase
MSSIRSLLKHPVRSRGTATLALCLAGLLLLAGSALVPSIRAQDKPEPRERIRPSGIDGSLLLCGEGQPSRAVVKKFLELAGGDKARLVLFLAAADGTDRAVLAKLTEEWQASQPESVVVLPAWSHKAAEGNGTLDTLRKATGVWIGGGARSKDEALETTLEPELRELLQRKGVVAATAGAAARTAQRHLMADGAEVKAAAGWDLLPGAVLDLSPRKAEQQSHFQAALSRGQGLFGIGIEEGAALLVQGRDLRILGDGQVLAYLADAPPRPARTIAWKAGGVADLTALRRAAVERSGPPFPSREAAVPEVPSGTLVIVGGGGMPEGLARKFIDLAGGDDALIVMLPTSMPDPIPANQDGFLKRAGARNVRVLTARERADVEAPEFLDVLKKATGVWFGGGRQWRFVDAYAGTKAEPLLHDVLRRGGVIGGSSAGASIQGEYMCRGNPLGPTDIMSEGYERGLNFLPGVAIDQHFTQRRRLPDMTALMKTYPQLLGIGLDEATALVVQGHVAVVTGRGKAHFYDRRKPVEEGKPDYEAVADGSRYDLKERKVLPAEKH